MVGGIEVGGQRLYLLPIGQGLHLDVRLMLLKLYLQQVDTRQVEMAHVVIDCIAARAGREVHEEHRGHIIGEVLSVEELRHDLTLRGKVDFIASVILPAEGRGSLFHLNGQFLSGSQVAVVDKPSLERFAAYEDLAYLRTLALADNGEGGARMRQVELHTVEQRHRDDILRVGRRVGVDAQGRTSMPGPTNGLVARRGFHKDCF